MQVGQAKAIATTWIANHGTAIPGFQGAYLAGSICTLPDDTTLAPWSDVDIMVVLDRDPPSKIGKLMHEGALLEVTFLPVTDFATPEVLLGRYHLAASFQASTIIADRSGELTTVQAVVAREFPRPRWVEARRAEASAVVRRGLQSLPTGASLPEQVLAWIFPTGVLTHVLLAAGLRNPTVRTRYEKVFALLEAHDRVDIFEPLLGLLGCAAISRERVGHHLRGMIEVFDAAALVADPPFPFASDITDIARPIAVDGSRDLIERGLHREAVFWIVATWSRSLQILDWANQPDDRLMAGYLDLLADLGLHSFADLEQRAERALSFLPEVEAVACAIMDAHGGKSED